MTGPRQDTSIRAATPDDAGLLRSLAVACPPLDVHTHYTYWVLASYFREQCFVAERGGSPVGFLTSITGDGRVLVWQIGVLSQHRGHGIAQLLIEAVANWASEHGYHGFDVSIDATNEPSRRAFSQFAERTGAVLEHVGGLDLRDPADPSFREVEDVLALRFAQVSPAG